MTTEDVTAVTRAVGRVENGRHLRSKVPATITVYFWVIKILTTAMGEATSDSLAHRNLVLAGAAGGLGLALALVLQLSRRRYLAWNYWFAVAMVAVFGTMAADGLHVALHVPYTDSSIFYSVVLAAVLATWYKTEKTISIHSIYTPRRELFYWATVLVTFALGTAVGDLTAFSFHLGFFTSGLLFSAAFAMPALAYWLLRLNPIVAFWIAYVLTRPLGASFADWIGFPTSVGGLGLGKGAVALMLMVPILGLVAYLAITRKDASAPKVPAHLRQRP